MKMLLVVQYSGAAAGIEKAIAPIIKGRTYRACRSKLFARSPEREDSTGDGSFVEAGPIERRVYANWVMAESAARTMLLLDMLMAPRKSMFTEAGTCTKE